MAEPTNTQRASRIVACLKAHEDAEVAEGNHPEQITDADRAQDMLTDLMHWCDQNEIDFDDLLNLSDMAYRSEIEDRPAAATQLS